MKKTIFITLAMALIATSVVIAKDGDQQCKQRERRGPDPEKRIEHQVDQMDKILDLTEEQEAILKGYFSDFDKAQQARMEEMRKQEKAEREALDSKIESILTADQKAKLAEMKEKGKEMMKDGNRGPRHGGYGPGGMGPGHGPGGMGPGHGPGGLGPGCKCPGNGPGKDAPKFEDKD